MLAKDIFLKISINFYTKFWVEVYSFLKLLKKMIFTIINPKIDEKIN